MLGKCISQLDLQCADIDFGEPFRGSIDSTIGISLCATEIEKLDRDATRSADVIADVETLTLGLGDSPSGLEFEAHFS
ncbi:hypothetical protein CDS [Bradyrhizobium sp.]|nr:hypothetical protein CDS [Bradyrhizobium sp.]